MMCFNSGNRSRIIARRTFPRKPVVPRKSIVLSLKASIAEISPVPWSGGGSPDSYSPRNSFHLHVVRDFINVSWFRPVGLTFAPLINVPGQSEETRGVLLKIRPVQESANASQRRSCGAGGWDSLLQDVQPQKAWAHPLNCLKTRTIAQGRYFLPRRTHECWALFYFRQAVGGERGPSLYGP